MKAAEFYILLFAVIVYNTFSNAHLESPSSSKRLVQDLNRNQAPELRDFDLNLEPSPPDDHDLVCGSSSALGDLNQNPPQASLIPKLHLHAVNQAPFHDQIHCAPSTESNTENSLKFTVFDLSAIPITPYYMMAALKFPLYGSGVIDKDRKLLNHILETIFNSSFRHMVKLNDFPTLGLPYRHRPQTSGLLEFLNSLCLKNIAFLHLIQPNFDEHLKAELKLVLEWLYQALLFPRDTSGSFAASTVVKHLQTQYEHQSATIMQSKVDDQVISMSQAHESQAILTVLGNYYKSTNEEKWRSIFSADDLFLTCFLKIKRAELHRQKNKFFIEHWDKVGNTGLLPWSDNSEAKHSWLFEKRFAKGDKISKYLIPVTNRPNSQDNLNKLRSYEAAS